MFFLAMACSALADDGDSFGAWQLGEIEDGYDTATALFQDALGTIKDESYSGDVTPRLAFVCGAGGTTARIDWKRFISSFSTEVGFKAGDSGFTWLKWKMDGSEKVTLSPSAEDSAKVAALAGAGERLVVEISPYSEGPVTVEFVLQGLDEGLEALQKTCP